jgi:hypothetical protein
LELADFVQKVEAELRLLNVEWLEAYIARRQTRRTRGLVAALEIVIAGNGEQDSQPRENVHFCAP